MLSTRKFKKNFARLVERSPGSQAKFYIVIFARLQGNPYRTLAACDMWLLTQIFIPCVTHGQGPVKRQGSVKQSRSSQAIKFFLLIIIKNFVHILYPTGSKFCAIGDPTGLAMAQSVKRSLDQSAKFFFVIEIFW